MSRVFNNIVPMGKFKSFALFLLFILSPFSAIAQCSQEVLVLLYRGDKPKKPLANVTVMASNASTVATDKNGRCTLNFRTLVPGDKVTIRRIEYPGYEVFNQDVLDNWNISNNNETFTIVMCESKYIKDLRDEYRRSTTDMIQNHLKSREDSLHVILNQNKITQELYEQKISELHAEYDEKFDNIENFIDRLAHADLSAINNEEKKIFDLIKKGDILTALEKYEKLDLVKNYATGVNTQEKLTSSTKQLKNALAQAETKRLEILNQINRHISMLQMLGGEENIRKSFDLYERTLMIDTTNFEVAHSYASYLVRCSMKDEAKRILRYCKNCTNFHDSVRTAMLEARIQTAYRNWNEATDILEPVYKELEALSIEKNNPEFYLKERGRIAIHLCNAYRYLRDTVKADYFVEASIKKTKDYYNLDKTNSAKSQLVDIYHDAFMHYHIFDIEPEKGINLLKEAITLQEELYKEEPTQHVAKLALLHNHLATLYRRIYDKKLRGGGDKKALFDTIINHHEIACKLYDEAYTNNPIAYLSAMPQNYRLVAECYTLYIGVRDLEKAKGYLDKCAYYLEKFDKGDIPNYVNEAVPYYSTLAYYHYFDRDIYKSAEALKEAVRHQEEKYKRQPKSELRKLADLYNRLGQTSSMINDIIHEENGENWKPYFDDMVYSYNKAVDLLEEGYKSNPRAYLKFLPKNYRFLASMFIYDDKTRDLDKAKYYLDKCKFYLDQIDQTDTIDYALRVAPYHYVLGDYYSYLDEDKSISEAIKAEEYYKILYDFDSITYKEYLMDIYNQLLKIYSQDPKENAEKIKEVEEKKNAL